MQGRGLDEAKQKIGSISKNKNVCFIIKDNKINQKTQINTKEIIKQNLFFFPFQKWKMSLNSFRCIFFVVVMSNDKQSIVCTYPIYLY